ncbi:flagellar assembly protein FliX [Candidatus Phycosocius spiralis]|uniref:Flagellar assembly protein FliX n=1 Tax=Candidatus Phycosocius spiralis TaxID=2815099 RepID=A0ABQ4PWQ0_9PROT|nr:flagellar assembly protein FliX [Candidatus Phycosocius spiralis]GIU67481.1 hypothetical protein PsB1_1635 [Candidatus Phycosocius spiralis]
MKVQGTGATIGSVGGRRASSSAAPGFALPSQSGPSPAQVGGTQASASLANVGSLLALQEQDEVSERRRRATKRTYSLLDQLEALRVAILGDGVKRAQVTLLAATLREQRETIDDPALEAILADVELRAEVELAKLERAL